MTVKINCPFHEDRTASCALYHDHFHCFGCNAHGPLEQLGVNTPKPKPAYQENLQASLNRIQNLPQQRIRGFDLPYDETYYYILWPDFNYYKARTHDSDAESKYRCPSGHKKPLFILNAGLPQAIIVEGEINALSLATVVQDWTIISPGSASEFSHKNYLPYYKRFSKIKVLVDCDKAGALAVINLKPKLLQHTHDVECVLMQKDCNDWLVELGQERFRSYVEKELGLPARLRCEQEYL